MNVRSLLAVCCVAIPLAGALPCAAAAPAHEPRLAYAQWLLDSGDAFGAAVELASIPRPVDQPEAARRLGLLEQRAQAAIDAQMRGARIGIRSASTASTNGGLYAAAVHLKEGRPDAAVVALEAILARDDAQAVAVHDAAHLLLARIALRDGMLESARAHYRAIRSPGPYASDALLELGWSYLLPVNAGSHSGETTRNLWAPTSLPLRAPTAEALASLRRELPFRRHAGVARSERAADLAAAVRVWQELIGRDPLNAAVREGQLALAYAFEHMGDDQKAVRHYRRAVDLLSRGRGLLATAIEHVRDAQLSDAIAEDSVSPNVDWPWWMVERRASRWWIGDDRPAPALFYAPSLMADAGFHAAVDRLQLIYAVRNHVDEMGEVADVAVMDGASTDAVRRLLAPLIRDAEGAVERQAIALLEAQRAQVEALLAEAHFALARMHEPDAFPAQADALASRGDS